MTTYADTATLMNSSTFRDAVTVAVAKFSAYILAESPTVPYHNQRAQWAKGAYLSPAGVGSSLLAAIAWDPSIQSGLPTPPSDTVLQAATEAVCNIAMAF